MGGICRRTGGITLIFLLAFAATLVIAPMAGSSGKVEEYKVLVIYTTEDGEINEYQRSWDMLIGHFTEDVTFVSSSEVQKAHLKGVTHLFYLGQVARSLPSSFMTLFDEYEGTFTAIGYNSEGLGDRFSFIVPQHEKAIDQYILTGNEEKLDISGRYIIDLELEENPDVLLSGVNKGTSETYPIVVKRDRHFFYAVADISLEESVLFGEVLHSVFQSEHEEKHPAYIRLEDVHPLTDPRNVREIGDILKEKGIPYMIAVIPVYTNPETGRKHHLDDSPKLLKLLKKLQKEGASIVLHGYTHQFRDSETGEGFEFWDVERNSPIYAPADENFTLREKSDFATNSEYESYLAGLESFESEYIRTKLTRGIQELANYGLYPLAFEAPHYTMSQNGYRIASEYFSTYVGQIQVSDKDWEVMESTPHITSPSFLSGMELLPETMGYVKPDDPDAIQAILTRAEIMRMTKDGILSAFYHPYLGVDGFKELIAEMEKLPDIEWIDLKKQNPRVKADKIEIFTENGEIKVKLDRGGLFLVSKDFSFYHFMNVVKWSMWGMAVVGGAAVLTFSVFIVLLQSRRMKAEG